MRLRRYVGPIKDDEKEMVRRFMWGLRPDIQGRLTSVTYTNLNELVERAVTTEEMTVREHEMFGSSQVKGNERSNEGPGKKENSPARRGINTNIRRGDTRTKEGMGNLPLI